MCVCVWEGVGGVGFGRGDGGMSARGLARTLCGIAVVHGGETLAGEGPEDKMEHGMAPFVFCRCLSF